MKSSALLLLVFFFCFVGNVFSLYADPFDDNQRPSPVDFEDYYGRAGRQPIRGRRSVADILPIQLPVCYIFKIPVPICSSISGCPLQPRAAKQITGGNYFKNCSLKDYWIIGHEASGTVVELGEEVVGFSIGDKVALEPGIPCRFCYDQCKQGRYNICSEVKCFILQMDGTLTRFLAYDSDFCHKLPEGMSFEEGALIEPLSVGVHTVNRCGLKMGHKILITGAGPIGAVCLLSAKAQGVGDTVVVDVSEERLEMIKKLGADYVFNSSGRTVEEIRDAVIAVLGKEPDATLECSGAESCISIGILTTKKGGTLALVGLGANLSNVPMVEVVLRELDIKGIFRYVNDFPVAIEQVASGRIDVSKLTNAHYSLEEVHEAFERQQKGDVMKVFIHC